jgi:cytochrome c peroxidase
MYQKFGLTQDYWTATGSKPSEIFKGMDKGRFQDTKDEADAYIFKVQQLRNVHARRRQPSTTDQ